MRVKLHPPPGSRRAWPSRSIAEHGEEAGRLNREPRDAPTQRSMRRTHPCLTLCSFSRVEANGWIPRRSANSARSAISANASSSTARAGHATAKSPVGAVSAIAAASPIATGTISAVTTTSTRRVVGIGTRPWPRAGSRIGADTAGYWRGRTGCSVCPSDRDCFCIRGRGGEHQGRNQRKRRQALSRC